MLIRDEAPGDADAIARTITAAFALVPHAGGNEADIVAALRANGALTVSLVAEAQGPVVGHVAFSPVEIAGADGWFGLGPVAVTPDRMRGGIGSRLIEAGLERLRAAGASGCVVLGDPRYYGRFGFIHDPALTYPAGPPEAFRRTVFSGDAPQGPVCYHPAFG